MYDGNLQTVGATLILYENEVQEAACPNAPCEGKCADCVTAGHAQCGGAGISLLQPCLLACYL